jgi:SAM-dependent methyltransferase
LGSSRRSVSPGRILQCEGCGFGYRALRSSSEALAALYRRMDVSVYQAEAASRDRTARRHLRILQRHARRGRLLDIGCASGLFLQRALAAGWEVTGVEPSETLAAEARAALKGRGAVWCATLEEAALAPGFDAVTLWDVLEHVPHPLEFLSHCRRLLAPEGRLFLNTPDLGSLQARLFGRRWPLLLPEHLNYFTRQTLELCARHAGLELVRFGRRPVWFSIEYVACRLAQHGVPGGRLLRSAPFLRRLPIPVSMGETYGVWRRA